MWPAVAIPFNSACEGEDCTGFDIQNYCGRNGFACTSTNGADGGNELLVYASMATTTKRAMQTASDVCCDGNNANNNTFSNNSGSTIRGSDLFRFRVKADYSESPDYPMVADSIFTAGSETLEALLDDDELDALFAEAFASNLLNPQRGGVAAWARLADDVPECCDNIRGRPLESGNRDR